MSKKNPNAQENEPIESESEEARAELAESTQAETPPPDTNLQEAVTETSAGTEESAPEEAPGAPEETSADTLLDDVRRSLIEEESDTSQKESKWWRRIGKKTKKVEVNESPFLAEIDLPAVPVSPEPVQEQKPANEAEQDVDQLDDLIDMLKAETEQGMVPAAAVPEAEAASEPEPEIDFDELKKQAFQPRVGDEEPENFSEVRSIALEGGEDVMVEVEPKAINPMEERISAFENALKPYRQYINLTLAFLGVVMAVVAALIIFRVYQQSRPQPVEQVSNLPFPASVSLPGGWSFKLGKGALQNGKWEPKGAEWLQGTEVCRWVALPWSRQLEAVVRTLNPKDPIDLVMSNDDKFVYQVYSVRQLTPEEMQKLDSNSPCLLLILIQPDAEKRWVLTALP